VAVVTGAASGTAGAGRRFALEGMKVVLADVGAALNGQCLISSGGSMSSAS
jgi:hypothetical protein